MSFPVVTERYKRLARSPVSTLVSRVDLLSSSSLVESIKALERSSFARDAKLLQDFQNAARKEMERQQQLLNPITSITSSFARLHEPDFQMAKSLQATADAQVRSIERMFSNAAFGAGAFGRGPYGSVFEQVGATAELSMGLSKFKNFSTDFLFGVDLELDEQEEDQEEEESLIQLPEDLREGLVDVRALPIWFMELIGRSSQKDLHELSWQKFEELIAEICEKKLGGKDVYLTRNSNKGDHGLDVVGTFTVGGIKTIIGYQAKKFRPGRDIPGEQVRSLYGALALSPHQASRGVLCTTSGFAPQAKGYFAQRVDLLAGWGPNDIIKRIKEGGSPF